MNDAMLFPKPEERKKYPSMCRRCGGEVDERVVNLTFPQRDGSLRVVEAAPAGVCDQCHDESLTIETARQIDELFTGLPSRQHTIPVWEFPQESTS